MMKLQVTNIFPTRKNSHFPPTGNENIGFNNAVFLSERETADRNCAMAYFMKEKKAFPPSIHLRKIMDLYFQVGLMTY